MQKVDMARKENGCCMEDLGNNVTTICCAALECLSHQAAQINSGAPLLIYQLTFGPQIMSPIMFRPVALMNLLAVLSALSWFRIRPRESLFTRPELPPSLL